MKETKEKKELSVLEELLSLTGGNFSLVNGGDGLCLTLYKKPGSRLIRSIENGGYRVSKVEQYPPAWAIRPGNRPIYWEVHFGRV